MKKELIKKLYDYLNFDYDESSIENDIKHDYLTDNRGRDGVLYYWYYDGTYEAAINTETGEIIDSEEIDFKLR